MTHSISQAAQDYLAGKRVLVTGACGTIGKKLIEIMSTQVDLAELTALDHNETELVFLEERFARKDRIKFRLGDIRDSDCIMRELRKIDLIFHTAAYKHVYMCERSPMEAVATNIVGCQNIISAAMENGVERLVFTSSDKAVNPTNVMGTSKLMGERLVTAAALDAHIGHSILLSTRFGNVLGSRGSVVPIFQEQIRQGGPVTLTDPEMTRFIMSLDQAALLVIESAVIGKPGEVLITKMPAINIADLAQVMIADLAPRYGHNVADIAMKVIGAKPGEKLYEELMNVEEVRRTFEIDRYFVIRPALHANETPMANTKRVTEPYNSSNAALLSRAEIREFLRQNNILPSID